MRLLALIGLACMLMIVHDSVQADARPAIDLPAAITPEVTLDVASPELAAGQTGKVMVRIRNVRDLTGFQFKVVFDPSVLEVVDSDLGRPGFQIERGTIFDGQNPIEAENEADNGEGVVEFGLAMLGGEPVTTGHGLLATITFRAKRSENSDLMFSSEGSHLADEDAYPIEADWRSARVLGDASSVYLPLALHETN